LHDIHHDDITLQSNRFAERNAMGQVVIRNIDDQVLDRLKARAAEQHKSLEQSLRELLAEAAKPSRAELIAELDRIQAMTPARQPGKPYPTAEQLVRESRDER
jgi:plasmid stability protein